MTDANLDFPVQEPYYTTMIDVGDGHSLYVAEFGNPDGFPVVYLHGGPGGGHNPAWQKYFDPEFYRIILFDQRGCGKSLPFAEIENNTTAHLIDDIEIIRTTLGIEKWVVGGGSWGSALALMYAHEYPQTVEHLLFRGVFFATKSGGNHIAEEGGATPLDQKYFDQYRDLISEDVRQNGGLISAYDHIMKNGTTDEQLEAAKRFMVWDVSIAFAEIKSALESIKAIENNPRHEIPITRIFMHYCLHEFDEKNKDILLNSKNLKTIPMDIFHGRQDYICPVQNAIDLHQSFPQSSLHICDDAGHDGFDGSIPSRTVEVTEKIKLRLQALSPQQSQAHNTHKSSG